MFASMQISYLVSHVFHISPITRSTCILYCMRPRAGRAKESGTTSGSLELVSSLSGLFLSCFLQARHPSEDQKKRKAGRNLTDMCSRSGTVHAVFFVIVFWHAAQPLDGKIVWKNEINNLSDTANSAILGGTLSN